MWIELGGSVQRPTLEELASIDTAITFNLDQVDYITPWHNIRKSRLYGEITMLGIVLHIGNMVKVIEYAVLDYQRLEYDTQMAELCAKIHEYLESKYLIPLE